MKKKEPLFLWLDLEMTGLDAEHDVILEIAAVITNSDLKKITDGPDIVIHQPHHFLEHINPWVKEQHTKSGLLERVANSSVSVHEAEDAMLEYIKDYSSHEVYFAGNSIYQDRTFLKKYMPRLNEKGHYRMIDVSTLKVLIQNWYPHSAEIHFKKSKNHRALLDVYESIEELQHYRKHFFINAPSFVHRMPE